MEAEKMELGEVRCMKCKKKVNIKEDFCPNCGAKIDPKGVFKGWIVGSLIGAFLSFVFFPVYFRLINDDGSELVDIVIIICNIFGVIFIIAAVVSFAFLKLNKIMRKKAFDEMGINKS